MVSHLLLSTLKKKEATTFFFFLPFWLVVISRSQRAVEIIYSVCNEKILDRSEGNGYVNLLISGLSTTVIVFHGTFTDFPRAEIKVRNASDRLTADKGMLVSVSSASKLCQNETSAFQL